MNFVLLLAFAVLCAEGAYEGDRCNQGICKKILSCPSAIQDIKKGIRPPTCGFDNNDVIVCCKSDQSGTSVLTTTQRPKDTTAEYIPEEVIYVDIADKKGKDGCEPIPAITTSKRTGQKAWDKCIEYQEKYVFPCERGVVLTGAPGRVNRCHHNADELIIGGTAAAQNEFPHMVLLGYLNERNKIDWECGGALISEKFILTAAHCIANKLHNNVSHALVGILRRSDESTSHRYGIKTIIVHDQYHSPIKYNDIALLELDRQVPLSDSVVPACLHTGDNVDESRASTTGWGNTVRNIKDSNADTLQKVILTKFKFDECSEKYEVNRNMLEGIDNRSQICYGDRTKSKDTCQGDSGGPLQVKNKIIVCMYTLVGVTSFGPGCGIVGFPGVYTRVANYLQWIEGIVWPN